MGFRPYFKPGLLSAGWLACVLLMGGCSDLQYAWQAASGHLSILNRAEPLEVVLEKPDLPPRLRAQLVAAQSIREFSIRALSLPDNSSYTRFADLKQPFVVWNVFAAPELSLKLQSWCFPVTGCLSYKGFYAQEQAKALGEALRADHLDVSVAGIPAYSTLGWTSDPLLNTFIYYPQGELARMVFHELAHQVVYIQDDTAFNESFATAVEELGVERWLQAQNNPALEAEYRQFDARRKGFRDMLLNTQRQLKALYASDRSEADKRADKQRILATLLADYRQVRDTEWGGWTGYDRFFAEGLNNAKLAGVGLYQMYVPAFKAMFKHEGEQFPAFYEAVKVLGQSSRSDREQTLAQWALPVGGTMAAGPKLLERRQAPVNE